MPFTLAATWWVTGVPRRCLQLAWMLLIVLLALPIPFDNLLPAWAILFFCLALIEGDGVMAMLGWLFTVVHRRLDGVPADDRPRRDPGGDRSPPAHPVRLASRADAIFREGFPACT